MKKVSFAILDKMFENLPKKSFFYEEFDKLIFNQIIFDMPSIESKQKTNTIAKIFNRSKDENYLSDWLAYLLENNTEVLSKLLGLAGFDYHNEEVVVNREYIFSSNRRIDFLIESEQFIIGIENKISAREQKNQLKDYSKEIKKIADNRDIIKILLKPESNSLAATNGFVAINYKEFVEELKNIHLDFIENLRLSFLLLDYIKHIGEKRK